MTIIISHKSKRICPKNKDLHVELVKKKYKLSTPDVEKGRSESIEPPPGFEDFDDAELVKKKHKRKQLCGEKKMTRSQKRLDKSNSQITTESIRKLAEESLEIGKILGVKVIAKEENAKRRIIASLKEEKRRKSSQKRGLKDATQ